MERPEMLIRAGFYAGMAARLLGDHSYALGVLGKADELTYPKYLEMVGEISERLISAGHLRADEDLFEQLMRADRRACAD